MTGRPFLTVCAVAVLALSAAAPARAQEENLPPGPLSVEDAVRIALDRNYDIAIAAGSAAAARGRALSSYTGVLPRLDANGNYSHESITGSRFPETSAQLSNLRGTTDTKAKGLDVSLNQSIFSWSNIQDIKSANAGARASGGLAEAQRLDVALGTRVQYYELYKAEKLRAVRDEGVTLAQDQLERAETLFELGSVARNDVLQARVNLQQARLDEISARNAVEVQRARLAQILGLSVITPLEIASTIPPPGPLAAEVDSSAIYRQALEERPDLEAARESVNSAKADLGSAKADYYPELFGRVNWFWNWRLGNGHGAFIDSLTGEPIPFSVDNDSDGWSAVAGVQLNIFDGLLREGQVNAAKGSLASERARLHQQELAVQVELKEAILGVREASQSIAAAQEGVGLAEENLKLAQERYQVGSGTILELNEAQVSLTESRSALVDAEAALRVAEARLDRARGGGLPPGSTP
jgi:outer membrane protein TolC